TLVPIQRAWRGAPMGLLGGVCAFILAGFAAAADKPAGSLVESKPAQKILISAEKLERLRAAAQTGAGQWRVFQGELDRRLNEPIRGFYQASALERISDYALGYLVLKESDPQRAIAYADKAIAVMKSGLRDYHKENWTTRPFLARGDGSTRTFQLPDRDIVPSSVTVYMGKVFTKAVKHGKAKTGDAGEYYP